jgi:hypothetical protein
MGLNISHLPESALGLVQNDAKSMVKKGDVWTCAKGITTEGMQNKSKAVAIMRIIDLLTA